MFVQTEYLPRVRAPSSRRAADASPNEPEVWAAHLAVVEGEATGDVEFETDRARFIGRGRTLRDAAAIRDGRPLSNTVGTVLDPSSRCAAASRVAPGKTARVAFWTIVAASRENSSTSSTSITTATRFERAATLAWTQAQVQLRHLGVEPDEAGDFQRLAGHVLYAGPAAEAVVGGDPAGRRRPGGALAARHLRRPADRAVRIDDVEDLDIVRQLLQAHEYWRMKQLPVDLVILNERASSYVQDLQIAHRDVGPDQPVAAAASERNRRAARSSCCAPT